MLKNSNNYPPRNVSYTPINMMSFYYWFRESSIKDYGVIYREIRVDGEKSVPFSTKIKLHRKHWNSKEQCFNGKESDKHQKTAYLSNYRLLKTSYCLYLSFLII
jgi:hypothetical protein